MPKSKRQLLFLEAVQKHETREAFKQRVAEKLRQQGLLKSTRPDTPSSNKPISEPPP